MIEKILPNYVQSAEHFGPDDSTLHIHPLEESLIAQAVEKRRREFITTRTLAHQVLRNLQVKDEPIMRGEKGMPLWPKGICGAMTHCTGYRAAVGAYNLQVRSLGIDAEVDEPLPTGILQSIALPVEIVEMDTLPETQNWERILFCAKEATYKTWFPITGRWLGFHDAHIILDKDGSFEVFILIDGIPSDGGKHIRGFSGKWLCENDLIITAIAAF